MKKLFLALALVLIYSSAWAQCSGVFPNQTVCGNNTGSSNSPRAVPVPSLVASSLGIKAPVDVATTGSNIILSGEQTIDGVLTSSSRVLVKDQSTASQNGIYTTGSGAWTRTNDFNAAGQVVQGTRVCVTQGALNAFSCWSVTTNNPITVGTTSLTFSSTISLGVSGATLNVGPISPVSGVSASANYTWGTSSAVTNSLNVGGIFPNPQTLSYGFTFAKIFNNTNSPVSSTTATVSFYAEAAGSNPNVVSLFPVCHITAANGSCWSGNSIVYSENVANPKLIAWEYDISPAAGSTPSSDSAGLVVNIFNAQLNGPLFFGNTINGGAATNGVILGGTYSGALYAALPGTTATIGLDLSQGTYSASKALSIGNGTANQLTFNSTTGNPASIFNDSSNHLRIAAGNANFIDFYDSSISTKWLSFASGNITSLNIAAPSSPSSGNVSFWADSTDLRFHDINSSGAIGTTVVSSTAPSNQFATGIGTNGVVAYTQPSAANLSNGTTGSGAVVLAVSPTLAAGTLGNGASALTITATQPTSPVSVQNAITATITSAGSASQSNSAFSITYAAGYTGSSSTQAAIFANTVAGTGNIAIPASGSNTVVGNFGQNSNATGATTGLNVGTVGRAVNGAINIGLLGVSQIATNSATNIGVVGSAVNTGTSPVEIGGFFSLNQTSIPSVSAALIADNASQSQPVFLGRVGGTTKFQIDSSGNVIATNYITTASHYRSNGTTPSVSSCGTTPAITGTDVAGKVTVGSGVVSSCTVTFAASFNSAPACNVSSSTAISSLTVATTTTTLVIGGTSLTSDVISYACMDTSWVLERDINPAANDNSPLFLEKVG